MNKVVYDKDHCRVAYDLGQELRLLKEGERARERWRTGWTEAVL